MEVVTADESEADSIRTLWGIYLIKFNVAQKCEHCIFHSDIRRTRRRPTTLTFKL